MLGFGPTGSTAIGVSRASAAVVLPPGDTRAPILTSATASVTSSSTALGSVVTDEGNGTLYFLAATSTPSTAVIKAGGSQLVTSAGSKAVSVVGLLANTAYRLYFLHRDAAGNDSAIASSASFTTPATAPPPAPGAIDAIKVPKGRNVIFAGNKRVVTFEGNKRVVTFPGNKREVKF